MAKRDKGNQTGGVTVEEFQAFAITFLKEKGHTVKPGDKPGAIKALIPGEPADDPVSWGDIYMFDGGDNQLAKAGELIARRDVNMLLKKLDRLMARSKRELGIIKDWNAVKDRLILRLHGGIEPDGLDPETLPIKRPWAAGLSVYACVAMGKGIYASVTRRGVAHWGVSEDEAFDRAETLTRLWAVKQNPQSNLVMDVPVKRVLTNHGEAHALAFFPDIIEGWFDGPPADGERTLVMLPSAHTIIAFRGAPTVKAAIVGGILAAMHRGEPDPLLPPHQEATILTVDGGVLRLLNDVYEEESRR